MMTPMTPSNLPVHRLIQDLALSGPGFDLVAWEVSVLKLLNEGADPCQLDNHRLPALGYFTADMRKLDAPQDALLKSGLLAMIKKGANPLICVERIDMPILAYHLLLASTMNYHLDLAFVLLWCVNEFEKGGQLLRDNFGNTTLASLFANNTFQQWPQRVNWIEGHAFYILEGGLPLQWLSSVNECGETLLHNMYTWAETSQNFTDKESDSFYYALKLLIEAGARLDAKDLAGRFVFECAIAHAQQARNSRSISKKVAEVPDSRDFVLSRAYQLAASEVSSRSAAPISSGVASRL